MKTFVTVVGFSLLVIAFFAGYSSFGIPQIRPAPPPQEEELDLGAHSGTQRGVEGRKAPRIGGDRIQATELQPSEVRPLELGRGGQLEMGPCRRQLAALQRQPPQL